METMTGLWRGWRRFAALSAIAAIIFHAALLLLHQPVQAADGAAQDSGTVVLCTAFGLKVVALADLADPPPVEDGHSKSAVYYCPVCLGAQLAAFAVIPDAFEFAKPDPAVAIQAIPSADLSIVPAFVGTLGSRAPPSIV